MRLFKNSLCKRQSHRHESTIDNRMKKSKNSMQRSKLIVQSNSSINRASSNGSRFRERRRRTQPSNLPQAQLWNIAHSHQSILYYATTRMPFVRSFAKTTANHFTYNVQRQKVAPQMSTTLCMIRDQNRRQHEIQSARVSIILHPRSMPNAMCLP